MEFGCGCDGCGHFLNLLLIMSVSG